MQFCQGSSKMSQNHTKLTHFG
uniref:Uncharacterized protein n=1 Tax=Anguilla anguilla TaxID=7936 RepID=A0A0E9SK19_ANGAN